MTAAVDRLDESLAAATPQLDDEGRRLALAIFRRLATGESAQVDNLAADADLGVDTVADRLACLAGGLPGRARGRRRFLGDRRAADGAPAAGR